VFFYEYELVLGRVWCFLSGVSHKMLQIKFLTFLTVARMTRMTRMTRMARPLARMARWLADFITLHSTKGQIKH